jgi:HAE1 family hydrophobic/amphiphilic exporter-1
MHIVDLSIKRPVTIFMGSLALVVFGILAYFNLPVLLLPETAVPVITIQTVYPGASPLSVENQLTKKIEDQIFSLGELDTITSYSLDSVSIVIANFREGKDENLALQEVKDAIDILAADLPAAARKPVITKVNLTSGTPVMDIIIEGDMDSMELYEYASSVVKDQFAQVQGVGSVELSVGEEREIRVDLHGTPVFERFLPVEQIAGILARANLELPGGNLVLEGQDIPVRFKGEFTSIEEIEDTDITTRAGVFKLRQLANVYDSNTVVRERTIFYDNEKGTRNENALLIRVMKNPSANTVSVIDGIMKRIPRIERNSGNRIRLNVIREDAGFIRDSVNDTLGNLVMGIILTGLVLLFFLHDWRSTIIISIAMPFSIISTFLVMQFMHISVNVLSLMGLSCAVGTLVANSVVVLENIFRHRVAGLSREQAASAGTKEVIMAVIASTATNVAVFVPLGGMAGAMGQILSSFAYTVVVSTIFSIIVSFTITPLLASRLIPESAKKEGYLSLKLENFFKKLEKLYAKSISFLVMRKRNAAILIVAVFAVFIFSIMGFSKIEMEMIPKSDGGKVSVNVELPQGSSLEMTAAVLAEIESRLTAYKEVRNILTILGNAGGMNRDVSVAQMNISLVPKRQRSMSNDALASAMTKTLSDIPGADIKVKAPAEMTLMAGAQIDLFIKGSDSAVLQRIGDELRDKVAAIPGITNAAINTKSGKRELVFEPNRKQIFQDGLTIQAVAMSLRFAIDGVVSTAYRESGAEYDIRVKMSEESLKDIEDIRNIPVVSNSGIYPLSRYADVHFENGYNMIMRVDKLQAINLTADILPGYTQGAMLAAAMRAVGEIDMPAGYSVSQAGLSDSMTESIVSMAIVFITAILLVYMLLAAILESLSQPLFILSTIPLSIIGITAGCLLTGTILNNIAMIGIVMLVGIVVNNAILILDYYNQLKANGMSVQDALLRACPAKLKAILMSNIAIILGTIPMALGIGESLAEMRKPMGIVVSGGIVSSMIMTLWLIPCLEFVVSKKKKEHKK